MKKAVPNCLDSRADQNNRLVISAQDGFQSSDTLSMDNYQNRNGPPGIGALSLETGSRENISCCVGRSNGVL